MQKISFPGCYGGARDGQAMLIAIISLTGAILGATAIAGFLTLYTIRSTTNYTASAQAIYAADAGANWVLMEQFETANAGAQPVFANAATLQITCYDNANNVIAGCLNPPAAANAIAVGASENTRRTFFIDIGAVKTPGP